MLAERARFPLHRSPDRDRAYCLAQSSFCEPVVRQTATDRTGRDTPAISDPSVDKTLRRISAFFMVFSSFDLDIDDVIDRPAARQEP
jgi:hypothetical protein